MSRTLLRITAILDLVLAVILLPIELFLVGIGSGVVVVAVPIAFLLAILVTSGVIYLKYTNLDDAGFISARPLILLMSILHIFTFNMLTITLSFVGYSLMDSLSGETAPTIKKEKPARNPIDKEKLRLSVLLTLGVLLVLLAGIIFATTTWTTLSGLSKVAILIAVAALFEVISITAERKLNLKVSGAMYYLLSNFFIAVAFIASGYFEVFGNWFSFNGAGKDLFIAITYLILGTLVLLGYIKYKKYKLLYLTHLASLAVLGYLLLFFGIAENIVLLVIAIITSTVAILKFSNTNSYAVTASKLCTYLPIGLGILLLGNIFVCESQIINTITFVLFAAHVYYFALVEKRNFFKVAAPVVTAILACALASASAPVSNIYFAKIIVIALAVFAISYHEGEDKYLFSSSILVSDVILFLSFFTANGYYYKYATLAIAIALIATLVATLLSKKLSKYHFERFLEPVKLVVLAFAVYNLFNTADLKGELIFALVISLMFIIAHFLKPEDTMKYLYFVGAGAIAVIVYLANIDVLAVKVQLLILVALISTLIITLIHEEKKYSNLREVAFGFVILAVFTTITYLAKYFEVMTIGIIALVAIYFGFLLIFRENKLLGLMSLFALFIPYYTLLKNFDFGNIEIAAIIVSFFAMIIIYTRGILSSVPVASRNIIEVILLSIVYLAFIFEANFVVGITIGIVALLSIILGYKNNKNSSLYYTGLLFMIVNIFAQLRNLWGEIPTWTYILFAGLVLIGFVTYKEFSRNRLPKKQEASEIDENDKKALEKVDVRTIIMGTTTLFIAILAVSSYLG